MPTSVSFGSKLKNWAEKTWAVKAVTSSSRLCFTAPNRSPASLIKGKYLMEMFLRLFFCKVCSVHFYFYESKFRRFSSTQPLLTGIVWHLHKCSAYLWCVSCVCQAGPHGALNPAPKAASGEVQPQDWQVWEWQNEYFFRNISSIASSMDYLKTSLCFYCLHVSTPHTPLLWL